MPRDILRGLSEPPTAEDGALLIPVNKARTIFAAIDPYDFDQVRGRQWTVHEAPAGDIYYAEANVHGRGVRMHAFITGMRVDHIDGDGLNNRRLNLRPATETQNARNKGIHRNNKTGFKGVSWWKGRFRAVISVDYTYLHLGRFDTAEEAAHAYDSAARQHFGEFACLNFPKSGERGARIASPAEVR